MEDLSKIGGRLHSQVINLMQSNEVDDTLLTEVLDAVHRILKTSTPGKFWCGNVAVDCRILVVSSISKSLKTRARMVLGEALRSLRASSLGHTK